MGLTAHHHVLALYSQKTSHLMGCVTVTLKR